LLENEDIGDDCLDPAPPPPPPSHKLRSSSGPIQVAPYPYYPMYAPYYPVYPGYPYYPMYPVPVVPTAAEVPAEPKIEPPAPSRGTFAPERQTPAEPTGYVPPKKPSLLSLPE
jgi:hypothetical protein